MLNKFLYVITNSNNHKMFETRRDIFRKNKCAFNFLIYVRVCVCGWVGVCVCKYSVIFAWWYSLRLQNVANLKNRHSFYNKNVSVLNELFFDILIKKNNGMSSNKKNPFECVV